MRKFREITESKGQIIFTFGRFNPPTTGHEKLIQKVASVTTATAVLGTGAFVGGNHQIDKMQGGPQKRQDAQIEQIRQVVREEVYIQMTNAWPKTSGPVKGLVVPKQDYRQEVPK